MEKPDKKEIDRLNQIQYRAGALHLTSQTKLEADLGWESLPIRAEFLGLSLFHKIHLHETRPLVRSCMPQLNLARQNRSSNMYKEFPHLGNYFNHSFFPVFTKKYNKLDQKLLSQGDLPDFKENLMKNLNRKR